MTINNKKKLLAVSAIAVVLPLLIIGGVNMALIFAMKQPKISILEMIIAKEISAREKDCADCFKGNHGIVNMAVFAHQRPAREENVYDGKQVAAVIVYVEVAENELSTDTIRTIGFFLIAAFEMSNVRDVRIIDTKFSRTYDGYGEEIDCLHPIIVSSAKAGV